MAGSGWQQLAASAKELAGQGAGKAKAMTATLSKAVVSAAGGGEGRAVPGGACCAHNSSHASLLHAHL